MTQKKTRRPQVIRYGPPMRHTYSLEQIMPLLEKVTKDPVHTSRRLFQIDGKTITIQNSHRRLYLAKGTTCVDCQVAGAYFVAQENLEREPLVYNLFLCVWRDGQEMRMTQDHIVPRGEGGPNTLDNLQPMCYACNQKKDQEFKRQTRRVK